MITFSGVRCRRGEGGFGKGAHSSTRTGKGERRGARSLQRAPVQGMLLRGGGGGAFSGGFVFALKTPALLFFDKGGGMRRAIFGARRTPQCFGVGAFGVAH